MRSSLKPYAGAVSIWVIPRSRMPFNNRSAVWSSGRGYGWEYFVFSFRPILKAPNPIGLTERPVFPKGRGFISRFCPAQCRGAASRHLPPLGRGGRGGSRGAVIRLCWQIDRPSRGICRAEFRLHQMATRRMICGQEEPYHIVTRPPLPKGGKRRPTGFVAAARSIL